MTEDQKKWIDSASYEELLHRWRNAPVGDPIFQDDTGTYYAERMAKMRTEVMTVNTSESNALPKERPLRCSKCGETAKSLMIMAILQDLGCSVVSSATKCAGGGKHDLKQEEQRP